MPWRAPVASTTGVLPSCPKCDPHDGRSACERHRQRKSRLFPLRQGFDFRVFLLEPLLHQSLVTLLRPVQGFWQVMPSCASSRPTELALQDNAKLVLDQLGHHVARPQRNQTSIPQWILLRYGVNPFHGARIQFARPSNSGFAFNAPHPPCRYCANHPYIASLTPDRATISAFASLNATYCADAHRLQRRMIQLASIVFSHAMLESDETRLSQHNKIMKLICGRFNNKVFFMKVSTLILLG